MPEWIHGGLSAASPLPESLLTALQEALELTAPGPARLSPEAAAWYCGRRILITGAGGSIGSELCRQLLPLQPEALVLLERDEYSLFEVDRQLRAAAQDYGVHLVPLLNDLRQARRMETAFRQHRPQIVLHTAACKHVPLLEENAAEAVSNNIGGTHRLLTVCAAYPVERCLLVSTDKAVNPANVMGATKRLNELMFSAAGEHCRWVRLGNVLGSRGSVVPIFRAQILQGGPVTLTDPAMSRYFIGLRPAVAGILSAAAIESSARRYLLEMGNPVRIGDLAQIMVRLLADGRKAVRPPTILGRSLWSLRSWLRLPAADTRSDRGVSRLPRIDVRVTGARPGERMHEQLLHPDEQAVPSSLPGLLEVRGDEPEIPDLSRHLRELENAAEQGDDDAVRNLLPHLPGLRLEYAGQ